MQAASGTRGGSTRCRWSSGSSGPRRRPGPTRWKGRRGRCCGSCPTPGSPRRTANGPRPPGPGRTRGSGRWSGGPGARPGSGRARCRGSPWRSGSAEIRVYPPVPVDDWPADLARLQVSGTDFDDPRAARRAAGRDARALAESGAADDGGQGHGAGRARGAAGLVGTVTAHPFGMAGPLTLTSRCGSRAAGSGRNCWRAGCRS